MRQGWLCASALIATLLLSACGSPGGSPTRSQRPITVTIGIVYAGGPAPGNSKQLVPGTIRLRGPATDETRHVADGQTTTFSVQPGGYTATARTGNAQCAKLKVKVTTRTVGNGSPLLIRCHVK